MSTATLVPETRDLSGDDAWKLLREVGRRHLLADAFLRLRVADGFSHARSLAFAGSLVLVQGLVAAVGVARAFGASWFGETIRSALLGIIPGPAGDVLTQAIGQASRSDGGRRFGGLALGLVGCLVTGATTVGQMERALNRIYGIEQDRPALHKYARAGAMATTVGVLIAASFVVLAFGNAIGKQISSPTLDRVWPWCSWPLGFALAALAITILFRLCPRRRQPTLSWLAFGATLSVLLWGAVTGVLGLTFRLVSAFGSTYGPLAGIVALQLWALLSSIAVLYGAAVAAQLEAVRCSTAAEPQDEQKVQASEPDAKASLVG